MVAVALVTSSFLPRFGGVEEHVLNLARQLRDRGHQVSVWTVDQGDEPATIDSIPVRYLPCPLPARSPGAIGRFVARTPGAVRSWMRAVRADQPDVLHVHCYGPNGVYASAAARLARRPLVVTSHGETFGDAHGAFDQSALLRNSLRRSLRQAAAVTAVSDYTAADLQRRFGADDVTIVPNAIDLNESGALDLDWLPHRYVFGLGRLVHNKGFDLLLEAFARLPDTDTTLVIGGDGPEREELRRRAAHLGVAERVLLPGRLSRADVVSTMSGAALVAVPSRAEAFGITVLEAWRAGVPVVATTHGGPANVVTDGHTGLVADPEDTAGFATALARVLGDQNFASSLGAAGRQRVADFSWDAVTAAYEHLYAAALR